MPCFPGCFPVMNDDRDAGLADVGETQPPACDPVIVTGEPGPHAALADRAHARRVAPTPAVENGGDLLAPAQPVARRVGTVPAVAKDASIGEARGAARDEPVAV